MEKTYDPSAIEPKWNEFWAKHHLSEPSSEGVPYCIMLPPPNVTGTLHMGHGFQHALMDALIRRERMLGKKTLWQPGTDHAGIATQMVVERQLSRQGIKKHDLGREAFIQKIWEWRNQSGNTIIHQIKSLGNSLDWTRQRFSMDERMNNATYAAFIRLYDQGLIYRGKRLVNWDPQLLTAVSDLEVITETQNGYLWYIRYPLANGNGCIIVATTRPETMLGDTAVAVHPDDERYQHLIGQMIDLPLTQRQIPIIADDSIDPEFGTGCVKITPAHDFNDYEMGKRHHLPMINIFTLQACMNAEVPEVYQGLDRFEARARMVADLSQLDLIEKIVDYQLNLPKGDRSGAIIEPLLTDQWYIRMQSLAEPAINIIKQNRLRFIPETWTKTYLQWLENIQDWCISRQLWWGHQIPVWYDHHHNHYAGLNEADVRVRYQLSDQIELFQDPDVLDTWFTASLHPFATLGWPEKTEDFATFYPTSTLVTGFDIIFFWVARMVMMGLHLAGDIPFREVYITGLIRDSQGHKMSKTKGNILDPLDLVNGIDLESLITKRTADLIHPKMAAAITETTQKEFPKGIEAHGVDALRFTFCALATTGRDINFDMGRIAGYRNFCNKLWNASRFVLMNIKNETLKAPSHLKLLPNRWITSRLQMTVQHVNLSFDKYRFDLIANELYDFTWNEYCDWYLEFAKCLLLNTEKDDENRIETEYTLLHILESILRLLHPLMPFITEEIWQKIKNICEKTETSIMVAAYPKVNASLMDDDAENTLAWFKQVVNAIRNMRGEMNISPAKKIAILLSGDDFDKERIHQCQPYLLALARVDNIAWHDANETLPPSVTTLLNQMVIAIPLAGLVDKTLELQRLKKEIGKLIKEQQQSAQKLENPNYVNKAPQAVVAKEKEHLQQITHALNQLQERYAEIEMI